MKKSYNHGGKKVHIVVMGYLFANRRVFEAFAIQPETKATTFIDKFTDDSLISVFTFVESSPCYSGYYNQ